MSTIAAKTNENARAAALLLTLAYPLLGAACDGTPTFYKDVEPIIQEKCQSCHTQNGVGEVEFTDNTAVAFAPLIAQKVTARFMPPWLPSPGSVPLVHNRSLSDDQIRTITSWVSSGAPLGNHGDHQDRTPTEDFHMDRPADAVITIPKDVHYGPYLTPGSPQEEVRCFVVNNPFPSNQWIVAAQFSLDHPSAIHHIAAHTLDAEATAAARAMENQDGRPGFDCTFGEPAVLSFSNIIGGSAGGSQVGLGMAYPSGTSIFAPADGSFLLEIHYLVYRLMEEDHSGVSVWTVSSQEAQSFRPISIITMEAPIAIPCPTGISSDPQDPCSREYALANVDSTYATQILQANSGLFSTCDTTPDQLNQNLLFSNLGDDHFLVPTSCTVPNMTRSSIVSLRMHMHTYGAQARIEVSQPYDSWKTLLEIPTWNYKQEEIFFLQNPLPMVAGQRLRLTCVYDNGNSNQWSSVTGEPGTPEEPPQLPLTLPHYQVWGPRKQDEMCVGTLGVANTPYLGQVYADHCQEAQRMYNDVCVVQSTRFVQGPCLDQNERNALSWMRSPTADRCSQF